MTTGLGKLKDLEALAERVAKSLQSKRRAIVVGRRGAGRSMIASALEERIEGLVRLDLLEPHEAEASWQVVLRLSAELDAGDRQALLEDGEGVDVGERLSEICRRLAAADRTLVVGVPDGWTRLGRDDEGSWRNLCAERGKRVLWGLTSVDELRVVYVGPESLEVRRTPPPRVTLARPRVDWKGLDALGLEPTYLDAAQQVKSHLGTQADISPLAARLAIGAVALGADASRVAELAQDVDALAHLSLRIAEGVDAEPELRAAMKRFLLLRRPLPQEALLDAVKAPQAHRDLFTECVGYSNPVKCTPAVRRALRKRLGIRSNDAHHAHAALGDAFAQLDGASEPWSVPPTAIDRWVEKVHHFANAGRERMKQLDAQHFPTREFYWARGRALSKIAADFAGAADVYADCVGRFPDDDYAWHYLGFNLARAGLDAPRTETAYRTAIALKPRTPWWNSRLVTFLINQARPDAAHQEWRAVVDRLDPDGECVSDTPWLARHVHAWVALAWVDAGRPEDAKRILDAVPEDFRRSEARLREATHAVIDALEQRELGGPVYPMDVPVGRRWTKPLALPRLSKGAELADWFPGRVTRVDEDGVEIFYAAHDQQARESKVTRIGTEEWKTISTAARKDGTFVELGLYSDGSKSIVEQIDGASFDFFRQDLSATLAYLKRWAQTT